MRQKTIFSTFAVLLWVGLMFSVSESKNVFTRRLVRKNFFVNEPWGADSLIAFMQLIKQWGYNGVLVDGELHKFRAYNPAYVQDFKRAIVEAKKLEMSLIPMTQQQSSPTIDSLVHSEAFFTSNTRFVVSGGIALPDADPVTIKNPGFEKFNGAMLPDSWKGPAPGMLEVDTLVYLEGKASLRMANPTGLVYLSQQVKFKANTTYRLTMKVKTDSFEIPRKLGFFVLAGSKWLLEPREAQGVQITQDWTPFTRSFNSMDRTQAKIMVCVSGKRCTGKAWFDDLGIEEVGLFETVRRSTLPVKVKSKAAPGKVFSEGIDYIVGDQRLTIPAGSAVREGDTLLVDWYKLANTVTMCPPASFCHPEVWESVRANIRDVDALFDTAAGRLMKYGEWRIAGWDPGCVNLFPDVGDYVGTVTALTEKELRRANSNREVYLWNDIYDPYHNAKNSTGSHLNRGPFFGSWKHLSEDIVILNWCPKKRDSTLMFFAGMNPYYPEKKTRQRQIVSAAAFEAGGQWGVWMDTLSSLEAQGFPDGAVIGINYHTYYATRYDKMDQMAQMCTEAGRWGTGPIPYPAAGMNEPAPVVADSHPYAMKVSRSGNGVRLNLSLPHEGRIEVSILDAAGRIVASFKDEGLKAGKNMQCIPPERFASGVYFVRVDFQSGTSPKRTILKRAALLR